MAYARTKLLAPCACSAKLPAADPASPATPLNIPYLDCSLRALLPEVPPAAGVEPPATVTPPPEGAAALAALGVPCAPPKGMAPPPTLIRAAIAAVFTNKSLKTSTFFVTFEIEPLSDTLTPIFTVLSAIASPGVASIKILCVNHICYNYNIEGHHCQALIFL